MVAGFRGAGAGAEAGVVGVGKGLGETSLQLLIKDPGWWMSRTALPVDSFEYVCASTVHDFVASGQ